MFFYGNSSSQKRTISLSHPYPPISKCLSPETLASRRLWHRSCMLTPGAAGALTCRSPMSEADVSYNSHNLAGCAISTGADGPTDKQVATAPQQMATEPRHNYFLVVVNQRATLWVRH